MLQTGHSAALYSTLASLPPPSYLPSRTRIRAGTGSSTQLLHMPFDLPWGGRGLQTIIRIGSTQLADTRELASWDHARSFVPPRFT